jgi:uncharacterized membrane protein
MSDPRTRAQRWADQITEFSGSWPFIGWFGALCAGWIVLNLVEGLKFDPYPFLFLNWTLTMVSTFQGPVIMMSQNRQNENDQIKTAEILSRLEALQNAVNELKRR